MRIHASASSLCIRSGVLRPIVIALEVELNDGCCLLQALVPLVPIVGRNTIYI